MKQIKNISLGRMMGSGFLEDEGRGNAGNGVSGASEEREKKALFSDVVGLMNTIGQEI